MRTSVGLVAYEGDRGSSGDRLALNGQLLTDAANPATNLFNSSVSFEGTNTLSQRIPAYVNGLGFDSDRMVADGFLANGATGATFGASTTLDQYLIQVVTFTTNRGAPRLVVDKTVADLNEARSSPATCCATRSRLAMTATTPRRTCASRTRSRRRRTLVACSPSGPGPAAAEDGRSVGFAVGALPAGGSVTNGFDVKVDAGAPDGYVIPNVASPPASARRPGGPWRPSRPR